MFGTVCYFCWEADTRMSAIAAHLFADDDDDCEHHVDIGTQSASQCVAAFLLADDGESDIECQIAAKRLRTSCDYQPNANDDQPDAKVPDALFVDTECKSAAASEVPWEHCRTRMEVGGEWWTWNEGIADIRYHFHQYGSTNLSEGVQLRSTVRRINWVLDRQESHFKIGIAHDMAARWEMYRESEWKPSHLFIIHLCSSREAAGFVESALIHKFSTNSKHSELNINVKRNDLGGTGPRNDCPYFVYLAVKPTID